METKLKNATLSLRVPSAFWDTDSGFAAFLEFAAEFHFVEEYAFFSTPLIGRPFPVDYLRRYWERLGERIERTRAFAPRVGINATVLNASMDTAAEMVVTLKTPMKQATVYRLEYEPVQLTGAEYQDGYTRFTLPDLDHWSIAYLVSEANAG